MAFQLIILLKNYKKEEDMSKGLEPIAEAILELCIFASFFIVALAVGIMLMPVASIIVLVMAIREVIKWKRKDRTRNVPITKRDSSTAITPINKQTPGPVESFSIYSWPVNYQR
ncbi:hypothetical protein EXU57_16720 [Segetibacter sp. 3557_3]|uniref:hypothetical protein n=1 Tax=Segetibacter sp. 3557_3 TaxID=2547429 RepID=UPI001058F631|nr:hypothetical protein [Segetibacter sp. 3557_3]TDH23452.1 hypothetical protein EXU57_16720 [Segetibacter sp. 3557_3]